MAMATEDSMVDTDLLLFSVDQDSDSGEYTEAKAREERVEPLSPSLLSGNQQLTIFEC